MEQVPTKNNWQKRLIDLRERAKKNPIISAIILFSVIIGFFAGLISNLTTLGNFFGSLAPKHSDPGAAERAEIKLVEGLTPGVNIMLIQNVLGTPAFSVKNTVSQTPEYIFVHHYFYVDAVVDANNAVQFLAITIRDKSFNPVFSSPGYPINMPSFRITLGKSTISSLPGDGVVEGCAGAHDGGYYETRYFGNPGDYEEFAFGFNEAGYLPNDADFSVFNSNQQFCPGTNVTNYSPQDLALLQPFREQMSFNTYALTAPNASISSYTSLYLGASYDLVRTLP